MALHLLANIQTDCMARCLAGIEQSDSLLLLGDGIYALHSAEMLAACKAATNNIFALAHDQQSRLPQMITSVPLISYTEWVEMSISLGPVVSWY